MRVNAWAKAKINMSTFFAWTSVAPSQPLPISSFNKDGIIRACETQWI